MPEKKNSRPRYVGDTPDGSDKRFRRSNRLADSKAYGRVFKQARRSGDKCFTVLCRSRSAGPARLGLAISKKNCKLASGRSRIKRIVRESFRHNRVTLEGLDVVVMNTRATQQADNRTLTQSLDRHWKRCRAVHSRPAET